MEQRLEEKLEQACWAARTLFQRNKATGSSANMSFRHDKHIFITSSGTCFGRLQPDDFTEVSMTGQIIAGRKPSKELPLHQAFYEKDDEIGAVIHTHSFYSTIWSCLSHEDESDIVPAYTPYLKMKVGKIGCIPFASPGSEALFASFHERIGNSDAFLLANHGPIMPGKDILQAFYGLEELEDSVRIAWTLRNDPEAYMISAD